MDASLLEILILYNSYFFGTLGVVANIFAVIVVRLVKVDGMKSFKNFILLYIYFDIVYSVLHMIIIPSVALDDDIYIYYSYRKWRNPIVGRIMLVLFGFFFAQVTTIMMVLFLYRYWTLSYTRHSSVSKHAPRLIWFIPIIINLPLIYIIGPIYTLWKDPGVDEWSMKNLTLKLISSTNTIAHFATKVDFDNINFVKVFIAFSISGTIVVVETIVMIYCSYYIYQITNVSFISSKTRQIHRQLLVYLSCQIVVFIVCCSVQVTIYVAATILNINLCFTGTISTCLMIWFPVFDSIILITCINSYRRTVIGLFNSYIFKSCNQVSVATSFQSTHFYSN